MFFYKGLSCPHCLNPFEETDDIVACPVCGAPHHRACWSERGGCACADAHGTDEQWSRETVTVDAKAPANEPEQPAQSDAVLCPRCHAENSPFAEQCSRCGSPLKAQEWGAPSQPPYGSPSAGFNEYTPIHAHHMPCGGVSPEAVLEGETAKDLAAVVRTNTPYYLPRFERMARSGSKASWNWAAFLIPPYWLLFRKQYSAGIGVLLLEIINTVIVNLLAISCFPSIFEQSNSAAMAEELLWLMQTNERAALAMHIIALLSLTLFCVRLIVALFGNRLYMKRCLRLVKKARLAYPEGYHAQLAMVGGTSAALALVGYMCTQLLPSFILMLIS